ncbi:DUF4190 domain-containing protein [Actinoplanes xinjiangensis]|uniref:DUF4190 domain-containing protein n=1 Tax=Actinoplanes xinjiangensis TaxID=512350 RepID=UPI003437E7CA
MTYPPDPYQPPDPYRPSDPYRPLDPYQAVQPPPPDPTPSYPPPYTPTSPSPSSGSGYPPPPYGGGPAYGPPPAKSPFGSPGYGAPYGPQNTSALAIASLVCSIAGVVTCISAPVGVVLGHLAKRQIRETGEGGEGLATAGLWVGYILTVIGVITALFYAAIFIWAIAEGTDITTNF